MVIRSAENDDLVFLLPLLKQLFSIEKDFTFDEARQLTGLQLLMSLENGAVFVAEQSGSVIGMVTGQIVVSTAEGRLALLVEDLVVDSNYRGKMVGRELLSAMAVWGNGSGAHRMQLLADQNNGPALHFYQKAGWHKTNLIGLRKYFEED